MSKKQNSIDWLYDTIDNEIVSYLDGEIDLNELSIAMLKLKEQAKAMHKKEIEVAYIQSMIDNMIAPLDFEVYKPEAEEYYNESFGGQE